MLLKEQIRSIVKNHRGSIHAYQKGQMIGFRAELK